MVGTHIEHLFRPILHPPLDGELVAEALELTVSLSMDGGLTESSSVSVPAPSPLLDV